MEGDLQQAVSKYMMVNSLPEQLSVLAKTTHAHLFGQPGQDNLTTELCNMGIAGLSSWFYFQLNSMQAASYLTMHRWLTV